jgi:hypothetical protein
LDPSATPPYVPLVNKNEGLIVGMKHPIQSNDPSSFLGHETGIYIFLDED